MKQFCTASLIALLVVLMTGCSDFNTPVDPSADSSTRSTARPSELMKTPNNLSDFPTMAVDPDTLPEPMFWPVLLPADVPLAESVISTTNGATVPFSTTVPAGGGTTMVVSGSFVVPKGALDSTTTISMTLDRYAMAIRFAPAGLVFKQTAQLNWTIKNVAALTKSSQVGFYYEDDSGKLTPMPSQSFKADYHNHTITLSQGAIPHFSRYSFCW